MNDAQKTILRNTLNKPENQDVNLKVLARALSTTPEFTGVKEADIETAMFRMLLGVSI